VPAESVECLRVEVALLERLRVVHIGAQRLEHVASGVLAVEAVVHEEQVGRRAAGQRAGEASDKIVSIARLHQLDVDLRLFLLERIDQGSIGVDLGRVAEDEKANRAGRPLVGPSAGDDECAEEGTEKAGAEPG
jgi:hypothetical protein